jgi:NAD(P)-dependent dehydrogenase (short-subunit alcohol dehydrogenase family)
MATARLEGHAVIVTGASTGIGAAIARRCALEGARVLVHGRDAERTRQVAAGLATEAASFTGDLGDPAVCEALVREATGAFGRLDGVVNNAALTTRSDLASTTPELLDRLLAVNLRAPLMIIRAALGELRASGGSVVNIGSINAYCGEPELLAYSLAKGALMTMTRNLANAHAAERVRFNLLNVGWTLTDNEDAIFREQGYPSGWHRRLKPSVAPSGALLTPEQVAQHAIHWLSPESAPVTGAVIDVEQYPLIGRPCGGEKLDEPCP